MSQERRGSAVAEARAGIGELVAVLVSDQGYAAIVWVIELTLLAAANVLVMHGINSAVSADAPGSSSVNAMLMFGAGIVLNLLLLARFSRRVLETFTRSVARVTERILDGMGQLDLEQFESVGKEEILSRVNEDASRIVMHSGVLIQALTAPPTILLSTLYVATLSVPAAVLALGAMVAIAALIANLNQKAMEQIRRDQAARLRMQEPIEDLLAGFKQLKQHRPRSQAVAEVFEAEALSLKDSREAYNRDFFARDALGRQAYFGLLGIIGFILPKLVPAVASEAGQLLIVTSYIFRPVTTMVMVVPLLARLGATWQRLTALAARLDAMAVGEPGPVEPPPPFQQLTLDRVTYRYPAHANRPGFSVGPCSLTLAPGEVVFITGANGSGKSTFVKLLCGLYRRHGGELAVDGQPVPVAPGSSWRGRFAAVFAEFALFERNYGLSDVDPQQVAALLQQLELGHKVRFAQGRFDTVALSTGQRKRLALLMALLQDRPIYVFDEWAADQDPHFREAFYRRILPELKARGKTVVAITHDDDAFDACDRRFHFHHGVMENV